MKNNYYFAFMREEGEQKQKARIFKSLEQAREYLNQIATEQHKQSPHICEYTIILLNSKTLFEGETIATIYQ